MRQLHGAVLVAIICLAGDRFFVINDPSLFPRHFLIVLDVAGSCDAVSDSPVDRYPFIIDRFGRNPDRRFDQIGYALFSR
jgi:hypothetical protein